MAPKLTIYVPPDLAAQVKEADLNVSQVCQAALRAEVTERATLRSSEIDDVIARLRATEDEEDARTARAQARWRRLGAKWAKERATLRELRAMLHLHPEVPWLTWQVPEDHSIRDFFAEEEGWDRDFREELDRDPSLVWFVEGALDVLERVGPLLDNPLLGQTDDDGGRDA